MGRTTRRTTTRALLGSLALLGLTGQATLADATWKSGACGTDTMSAFAAWRGTPLGVATGWAPKDNWDAMLSWASGAQPRTLRSRSANVSVGVPMLTRGSSLASCAAGQYDGHFRTFASRLVANGLPDPELRLGWEANGDWYPWTAVGRPAAQWKQCWTRAARALKAGAPNARIAWHMAKKSGLDVDTIWPDDASLVTNVGVSHYDDDNARFGTETANGSPWGLRAWLAFARGKGKKLEMVEWGVGRRGDRPDYIQEMHDFFHEAGASLAHEGYFNCGSSYRLHPAGGLPRTAERYRALF